MKTWQNVSNQICSRIFSVLVLLCTVGLCACAGGGTSGSGGGTGLQLSGSLRLKQGTPASGVAVSARALAPAAVKTRLGNSAVTDNNGAFTLFVDAMPTEDVELSFNGPSIDGSYRVTKIPAKAAIVRLDLRYDDETSSISEEDVKFEDENGGDVESTESAKDE